MIQNILARHGLSNFIVEYYSINPKQKIPTINCKVRDEAGAPYMLKIYIGPKEEGHAYITKCHRLLEMRVGDLLKPQILSDQVLLTKYITGPTISSLRKWPVIGRKLTYRTVDWIAAFHDTRHDNGVGYIHGDFSAFEVILHGGNLVVLDWEDFSEYEEQLVDVLYLIFRETFQEYFYGSSPSTPSDFLNSVLRDDCLHPYLARYQKQRPHIAYNAERRILAVRRFLELRIRREFAYYSIPRRDRYICRKIYGLLEASGNNNHHDWHLA